MNTQDHIHILESIKTLADRVIRLENLVEAQRKVIGVQEQRISELEPKVNELILAR